MGEPGRLSLDDRERLRDDRERLVCSKLDCFVILRKSELRFLLGNKERASDLLRTNSQLLAPLQPLGRPLPGPSFSSYNPPIKTERTSHLGPLGSSHLVFAGHYQARVTYQSRSTSSGSSHLSSPALSCCNSPIREGRSSPASVQSGSSLKYPLTTCPGQTH